MKCTEHNFLPIRGKSGSQLDDGQFIVKIGLMKNLHYLLDFFKTATAKENNRVGNDSAANKDKHGFLKDFIDTSTSNLTKSSNYFRCSDTIKNFALLLYILGGKLTYEFIQLNLPGSLSNLTMFNIMISNLNSKFSEEEFQFDQLQKHLDDLNV
ncbi:unnamed protein product [Rotaria sp. Silwood2]|nr:unnamed protein product [Rotaria sp. Silwood2]